MYYVQDKKGKQVPLNHSSLDEAGGTGSVYTEAYSGKGVAALRKDHLQLEALHFALDKDVQALASTVASIDANFNERAQDAIGSILQNSSQIQFTYDDATPYIEASLALAGVLNSNLANMQAARIKGRAFGAGTGDPQDLTATQLNSIVGTAALNLSFGLNISSGTTVLGLTSTDDLTTDNATINGLLTVKPLTNEAVRLDAGAGGSPYIAWNQGSTRRGFQEYNNTAGEFRMGADYGPIIMRPGASGTTTEIARFTNTRVGIGNSNPQHLLHVGDGSDASGLGSSQVAMFSSVATSMGISVRRNDVDVEAFLYAGSIGLVGTVSNHGFRIRTNNTDAIAVDTSQNVSLGSASAHGKLDITQPSTTATIPVLELEQSDLSEEFINFVATVGAGNPIQTGGLGAYYGKVRVAVNGTFKYMALYNS